MMPKWTKSDETPVRVAFLLCDEFSNLCLANCLEPLRAANRFGTGTRFDWRILTPDGAAVRTSSGIQIVPHGALASLSDSDYLFILVSYSHEQHDTAFLRSGLRLAARRSKVVAGFDAGPWLMASAGLLSARRATAHGDILDAFAERFPDVDAVPARVVRDGRRWTCAGALSALDLTLDLIGHHAGVAVRLDIEALFLRDMPSSHRSGAEKTITDPLVQRALGLMRDRVENPMTLDALARALSCQPRTLDRRFQHNLGAAPGTVYRHVRLTRARQLIETTSLSISDIALRSGYESPAALSRAIRRLFGQSPRDLRRAAATARP